MRLFLKKIANLKYLVSFKGGMRMLKKLRKLKDDEHGQSLIFVIGLLVILLGFTALVVDVGNVYLQKAELQNAADAAALAGAQELPMSATTANSTAISYASKNGVTDGVQGTTVTPQAPYAGDDRQIEVVTTRNVSPIFAQALNLTQPFTVSASAVAQKKWLGDALPFINLDKYGSPGGILNAWNKVNPGDKERINNDDLFISTENIKVDYEDGDILFKKGKDLSQVQDPLKEILFDGATVYLFALRNYLVGIDPYDKLNDNEEKIIPIEDTVLLRCTVIGNYEKNNDKITLILENIYNYDSVTNSFPVNDIPPRLIK